MVFIRHTQQLVTKFGYLEVSLIDVNLNRFLTVGGMSGSHDPPIS